MKGGLARQRFEQRRRHNIIVGQLNELYAKGFTADQIRAAGPNAYQTLTQRGVPPPPSTPSLQQAGWAPSIQHPATVQPPAQIAPSIQHPAAIQPMTPQPAVPQTANEPTAQNWKPWAPAWLKSVSNKLFVQPRLRFFNDKYQDPEDYWK